MNSSVLSRIQQKAAADLYNNAKFNRTTKELILKSLSRSKEYIEAGEEFLLNSKYGEYAKNINYAIIIIQNLQLNLDIENSNVHSELASELYSIYAFILKTLKSGIKNRNTKDYDECKNLLVELNDTFEKAV